MQYLGEIAALGTAFCWAGSSLSFTAAGKRIGSVPLNLIRLVMALVLLSGFVYIYRSRPLPTDATAANWLWLSLSGLVGFAFGDLCLFRALVLLEARLAMLVMTLAPPMAALIAWLAIGEGMIVWGWVGMMITVGGVALVVTERHEDISDTVVAQRGVIVPQPHRSRRRISPAGVALAALGAMGQAGGMVLGKVGLGDYEHLGIAKYDVVSGTQIRAIAGIAGFVALFTAFGWWPRVAAGLRHRGAMAYAAVGSAVGPSTGVVLAMVAMTHTSTGAAMTIMAISPIILIPVSAILHKERITLRAVAGSVVAVSGVALLFVKVDFWVWLTGLLRQVGL